MKIYLASSWKNPYFNLLMELLKRDLPNDKIYNFRDSNSSFGFHQLKEWNGTLKSYQECRKNYVFEKALENDFCALQNANLVILLLPSGRSSHLEIGYAIGKEKQTILFNPSIGYEFDLMHSLIPYHAWNLKDLFNFIWMSRVNYESIDN